MILYRQINNISSYRVPSSLNNRMLNTIIRYDGISISEKNNNTLFPYKYIKVYIENSYQSGKTLERLSQDKLNFKLTGKPYEYSYEVVISVASAKNITKKNQRRFFDKTKVDII